MKNDKTNIYENQTVRTLWVVFLFLSYTIFIHPILSIINESLINS